MIHSKFSLLLLTFMSWYDSCVSCPAPEPQLPGDPGTSVEPPPDTGEEDTADTTPPPACDFEEVEPNDTPDEANEMDTELWACGVLSPDAGAEEGSPATDFVKFTVPESGWLSMWGRGEDIGSYANLQMNVAFNRDTSLEFVGSIKHSPGTSDPRVTIPVEAGDVIDVALSAENFGGTDQQLWEFLPTVLKEPPVYWTMLEIEEGDEVENNDARVDAHQLLVTGDSVYGVMGVGDDTDVYLIDVPEGSSTITVDIEAYDAGSPLDAKLVLMRDNPDYGEPDESRFIVERSNDNGREADLAPDPRIIHDTTVGGEWRVEVENVGTFASRFNWYVLHVTITDGPEDEE